jgi:hypothetical protein
VHPAPCWRSRSFPSPGQSPRSGLTTPKQALGFEIGDDYMLATYTQLTDWWKKLDAESDRMRLVSIGKTAEGRDQWMAIITSPANFAKLDHYRQISARLSRAEGLTDEQAKALAKEGKAVVWIDGGLHATEVLGAHQLMEHVWQMLSRNDEGNPASPRRRHPARCAREPRRHGAGVVLVHAEQRPKRRSMAGLPRLYQKYIGHDNNRDFYLNAQPESENMSRVMYREWYPQVMYNHHQTGPAGTVMFAPPFRDRTTTHRPAPDQRAEPGGAAMHTRFAAEGKAGGGDAERGQLPNLVERRAPNHGVFSQPDRDPDGDHRQPDADGDSFHPGPAAFDRRPALPDPTAALEVPPVDRVRDHGESAGSSTWPRATGSISSTTST